MKKFLTTFLSLITVVCINTTFAIAAPITDSDNVSSYTISIPYSYPVTPYDEEWASFDSHVDMINACQIPEDILTNMTTEALLESILSYPLLGDMLLWDDVDDGYLSIATSFNGLAEFLQRPDAPEVLENYSPITPYSNDENAFSQRISVKCLNVIRDNVTEDLNFSISPLAATLVKNNNVKTPNGTQVAHYEGLTYTDHGLLTQTDIDDAERDIELRYPNATRVVNRYPAYNCHSYAWHSTSTSNRHWINNPSPYWQDGSYKKVASLTSSQNRVTYAYNGAIQHSAIVYNPNSKIVTSKWGALATYRHSMTYSPYSISSTVYSYYLR